MVDKIIGIFVIILWLCLYTGGIVFGTQSYRQLINQESDLLLIIKSGIIIFLFYTLSNIAILCCLASIIGGICKGRNDFLILATNGIFIYLLLISGLLLFGTNPFETLNQSQYIRLAGTTSLFSFLVGYNPKILSSIISKVEDLTTNHWKNQ